MPACDTCGNDYERAFTVRTHDDRELVFDSIECAAHQIAPACEHCGCRVLGHGVQVGEAVYCCASCARHAGADGIADRA